MRLAPRALRRLHRFFVACALLGAMMPPTAALAQSSYRPIVPNRAGETVVLTGHDLGIDQVVAIARYGAKVALSPEAKQRQSDAYGLLLEACPRQGIGPEVDEEEIVRALMTSSSRSIWRR